MRNVACGLLAAWALTAASPVVAATQVRNKDNLIIIIFLFFSQLDSVPFIQINWRVGGT